MLGCLVASSVVVGMGKARGGGSPVCRAACLIAVFVFRFVSSVTDHRRNMGKG